MTAFKLAFACFVALLVQTSAATYSESLSIEYAKLSGAAYCSATSLKNWDCGPKCSADITDLSICQGKNTKSFVAHWGRRCLVVFEGTSNLDAWVTDLEIAKHDTVWDECSNCQVHGGYLDEWYSLKECIHEALDDIGCGAGQAPLYVTGHSLGAGLVGISMMSLHHNGWSIAESYNFGMPRTGDEEFAKEFDSLFSDRFFRVTHHRDPIPQLPPVNHLLPPPHFEHVSPEIFYKGDVKDGHVECSSPGDKSCSAMYSSLVKDLFYTDDHLDYMGVHTGSSGCNDGNVLDGKALHDSPDAVLV